MVQVPGQGGAAQLTSLTGSSSIKSPDVDAGTLTAVWSLVCDLSRPQRGSSSSSAAAIGTESAEAECGGHTGSAGGTAVGSRVRGAADHTTSGDGGRRLGHGGGRVGPLGQANVGSRYRGSATLTPVPVAAFSTSESVKLTLGWKKRTPKSHTC